MSHQDFTPFPANRETAAGRPAPTVLHRTPKGVCGRAAGPVVTAGRPLPANQNEPTAEALLFDQLPEVIREAVDEWAGFLRTKPWRLRRELMQSFARIFADQFRMHAPQLSDEEYEGMKEIGFTCLLERLDHGNLIADLHQARIYLESVHETDRLRGRLFVNLHRPKPLESAASPQADPQHKMLH